jgi:endonuclease III
MGERYDWSNAPKGSTEYSNKRARYDDASSSGHAGTEYIDGGKLGESNEVGELRKDIDTTETATIRRSQRLKKSVILQNETQVNSEISNAHTIKRRGKSVSLKSLGRDHVNQESIDEKKGKILPTPPKTKFSKLKIEGDVGIKSENFEDEKSTKLQHKAVMAKSDAEDNPRDRNSHEEVKNERSLAKSKLEESPKKDRAKAHPYGLTPGRSPFPDHVMPTPEACEEVYQILRRLHDPDNRLKQPEVIPPPSMDVTGCGEVPDLLDAMMRTLLSAATTNSNAAKSLKGLKDKFGLRTTGLGKGSVDWDAVHQSDVTEVIDAIKKGGLAKSKGTNIKAILKAVYEKNLKRKDALLKEKDIGEQGAFQSIGHETQAQKDAQLARFEETLLCMDYIYEMTSDEAMDEMIKLPGIGVKTASCVILFNMQRPSFAVDTHIWRLCKWLGWVPPSANRDKTFSHCEVRVPDHLKYYLHQLFIAHGKHCPRCRAGTGPTSEKWETICPIEHLVERTGKRKVAIAVIQTPNSLTTKFSEGISGKKGDEKIKEGNMEDVDVSDDGSELSELEG